MNEEQEKEFQGILIANGWNGLMIRELKALRKLVKEAKTDVIEFRGTQMMVKFGEIILANYIEHGI